MKTIKNTLEVEMDRWDDPGDYPSNAGAGPLPSYTFLAGLDGEVQIELTDEEIGWYNECADDFVSELDIDLPNGILSVTWDRELKGNILTLTATAVEGDPDYCDSDGPEYDPMDRYDREEY